MPTWPHFATNKQTNNKISLVNLVFRKLYIYITDWLMPSKLNQEVVRLKVTSNETSYVNIISCFSITSCGLLELVTERFVRGSQDIKRVVLLHSPSYSWWTLKSSNKLEYCIHKIAAKKASLRCQRRQFLETVPERLHFKSYYLWCLGLHISLIYYFKWQVVEDKKLYTGRLQPKFKRSSASNITTL